MYVLCARTTPEEFERAVRGTELDASIFLEDGWLAVEEPPAPASQVMDDSVDVGMMDGAGHALAAGASAYLAAYVHPRRLIDAVKNLFQSIELLLKVRLEAGDPLGLQGQPNNPTVITRLAAIGVTLSPDEADTVAQLRRLRNDLQHNTARFNHRRVLGLCRSALIVIARFAVDELNSWAGDVTPPDEWHQLLSIEEIRAGQSRSPRADWTATGTTPRQASPHARAVPTRPCSGGTPTRALRAWSAGTSPSSSIDQAHFPRPRSFKPNRRRLR